jgi:lysophospholipase L1-like esterase
MKASAWSLLLILGLAATVALRADDNPAPASTFDVVFIGDSITYGVGVPNRDTQAAPVIAAQDLQKQLGGNAAVYMSNQGQNGHTTVDFLPGGGDFSGVEAAAKGLVAGHPGQLVFSIMLGTNDSANRGPNGSPVSAVDYAHNLEQIINKLLAEFPDGKFVINHPTWYSPNTHNGSDYEGDSAANRLKSYFPAIDLLVADYASSHPNHVYVGDTQAYDYFASHQEELNGENGQKGTFYLHPNVRGAQSLGGFWAAALADKLNP